MIKYEIISFIVATMWTMATNFEQREFVKAMKGIDNHGG